MENESKPGMTSEVGERSLAERIQLARESFKVGGLFEGIADVAKVEKGLQKLEQLAIGPLDSFKRNKVARLLNEFEFRGGLIEHHVYVGPAEEQTNEEAKTMGEKIKTNQQYNIDRIWDTLKEIDELEREVAGAVAVEKSGAK